MRIGILQCDETMEVLRPEFGGFAEMIIKRFHQVRERWTFPVYNLTQGRFPDRIDECDGYITTGSHFSVYETIPWIEQFAELTREADATSTPFVGICFGHQMIAHALGGRVDRSEKGWGVGVSTVSVQGERAAALGLGEWPDLIRLVVSHQDQVLELPRDTQLLGGNAFCPNYFLLRRQSMLGIQGHPEYSKEYSNALMRARKELIGEPAYTQGQESLKDAIDDMKTFEAIAQFFEYASVG